uniref:Phosphodiesterase n=2 Tax=Tetraselmis sp. GSL018 TaxID=582737 RepID=A0A061QVJ4_9CHLO|mmetsp:Transcript_12755/g.30232  ORF Transcript_12755/g.30232 Transcript_12755/m.30232 type:complete len:486 (-) Transcript_12755:396-1853(-)
MATLCGCKVLSVSLPCPSGSGLAVSLRSPFYDSKSAEHTISTFGEEYRVGFLLRNSPEEDLFEMQAELPSNCRIAAAAGKFNAMKLAQLTPLPLATVAVAGLRQPASQLGLNLRKLQCFAVAVERLMPNNPYHNDIHVCDVLQLMHLQVRAGGPLSNICSDPVLKLSVLLATLVHDVGHPGYNNAFLNLSKPDVVQKYGSDCPAERMHVAVFRALLKIPALDFLDRASLEQRARIVRVVERVVLATDMSKHMAKIQQTMPSDAEEKVMFMLEFAMKVSDMSHTVRSFHVHHQFVDRLKEEFYKQGDSERQMGLTVTTGMDRDEAYVDLGLSQVHFLKVFIQPLFDRWQMHCSSSPLVDELIQCIRRNIGAWSMLAVKDSSRFMDGRLSNTQLRVIKSDIIASQDTASARGSRELASSLGIEHTPQDFDSLRRVFARSKEQQHQQLDSNISFKNARRGSAPSFVGRKDVDLLREELVAQQRNVSGH